MFKKVVLEMVVWAKDDNDAVLQANNRLRSPYTVTDFIPKEVSARLLEHAADMLSERYMEIAVKRSVLLAMDDEECFQDISDEVMVLMVNLIVEEAYKQVKNH